MPQTPPTPSPLGRKLNGFLPLGAEELACLDELQSRRRTVPALTDLVHEGQTGHHAFILQTGWAISYKMVPNGGRQIIGFPLPGNFMGLRSVLLRTSDHSFACLTESVVSEISPQRMIDLFHRFPRLATAILWAVSREEAMVVEHLVNIGRRTAIERLAHLLIEIGQRLKMVDLVTTTSFACPLNQYVLADALGLTAIHVNRILRQLRERELITLKDQQVIIHDLEGLRELAGYDNAYLNLEIPVEIIG